jgi:hypothetical protein
VAGRKPDDHLSGIASFGNKEGDTNKQVMKIESN